MIDFPGEGAWSSSSGIFYWVISTLARDVKSPVARDLLAEVDECNLGFFSLGDLPGESRNEVVDLLVNSLAGEVSGLTFSSPREESAVRAGVASLSEMSRRYRDGLTDSSSVAGG